MNKFNKGGRGGFGNKFNDRGGRPNFGGNRGGFGGGFGGGRRDDRGPSEMFDAVCDECKRPCQVPFRPNGDKPVYCKNCFDKRGGGRELGRQAGGAGFVSNTTNDIKTQLSMINIKLDKVIKILDLKFPKNESVAPVMTVKQVVEEVEKVVETKPKKVSKAKKSAKK